jgi:ribose/xylose/arabinose/galactoside ABC-type transport system permease subunit
MWQTAVGLAILAILQNGLNLLDINTFYQYVIKGCLIIGAVSLDVWVHWLFRMRQIDGAAMARRLVRSRAHRASTRS